MIKGKWVFLVWCITFWGSPVWGGDTATFVDLGFSPDGSTYMFGQYGVQEGSLRPWAELYVVDVARNSFVSGGQISSLQGGPVLAGQDGSGTLYRLMGGNMALATRYGIDFVNQGQPLYIALDTAPVWGRETIEFRDFERGASYQATILPSQEGVGASLRSSFQINLERTARDGTRRNYTVGNPQIKRSGISAYRIARVLASPGESSIIFVIEMKRLNNTDFDLRYMIEALRF